MMQTATKSLRARAGFTLIELMITVSLLGIIGAMLTGILVRQQRFHRAVANVSDARARMRDIATIMPTDLRGISTAGGDILSISDTSMQFRAFVGASVLCNFFSTTVIELPPRLLHHQLTKDGDVTGGVLTAWINPPEEDDIAYIYDDGAEGGNVDDSWTAYAITAVASEANSAWCPSDNVPAYTSSDDNSAVRYHITLAPAPDQATVKIGAPIRFAREVRYSVYQAADNNWYVGFQRCPLGECGDREVLAGPVLSASEDTLTSGLFFVYYNRLGTRMEALSATDTIARINVGIRTTSESLLKATTKTGGSIVGGDSLRFTVGIRNRI